MNEAFEAAMKQTWQMVDPLKPPGTPGSYARGHHQGVVDALTTLRANYARAALEAQAAQRAQQAAPTDPTLRELFQTMLASSTQILDADGTVTGYQIKTGAAHRIIGMLGLYVPLNLPAVSMQTPATITRTDAGWKQLNVFGVVIVGRYGESGGDDDTDIEALAARINAAAPSAQQAAQPLTEHVAEIEGAIDRIMECVNRPREPHWGYRNTITTNRELIRRHCADIRAMLAAATQQPPQEKP